MIIKRNHTTQTDKNQKLDLKYIFNIYLKKFIPHFACTAR